MSATARMTLSAAARRLGRSRRTLQRWCAAGMPHERTARATLVDLDVVERWRGSGDDALHAFARAIDWALYRDAGAGRAAWKHLRIEESAAIALLLLIYDRAADELGRESGELPPSLRRAMSRLLVLRGYRVRGRTDATTI